MPHEFSITLPKEIGVIGTAASEPAKGACGRWRTDAVEIVVAEGRYKLTACSLHLIAAAEGPCRVSSDDNREHRVLIPAGLFRANFAQADSDVEVRVGHFGTMLAFLADRKRVAVEVGAVTGALPPTEELIRLSRTSARSRNSTYRVAPRTFAKVLRIANAVCPDAPLHVSLGPCGRLRFDAHAGESTLCVVLQTPPTGQEPSQGSKVLAGMGEVAR